MAVLDATNNPIYGQAYRLSGVIVAQTTGVPISGAFTGVTGTISKDGGAFSATGVTVTQIGTTGYFAFDINATGMTANTIIASLVVSNATAREWQSFIQPMVLTETAGHWLSQTVKKPEQGLLQVSAFLSNRHTVALALENVYARDDTTVIFSASISGIASASSTQTRAKLA